MRFRDAVVLVTGSSSGIGAAIARLLAGGGARVLLHGRNPSRLASVSAAIGGAPTLAVDLAEAGSAVELAARAREPYGQVDGVVHSAGLGWYGELAAMAGPDLERLLRVNLLAPIALTRELLPGMLVAGHGHVAFVASIAGATGVAYESVYAATKAGLIGFADSLTLELSGRGVEVSVVSPGPVRTAFFVHRGTLYRRRFPRPVDADRIAAATVHGIAAGGGCAVVPRWLGMAPAVRAVAPSVYRVLARRFG